MPLILGVLFAFYTKLGDAGVYFQLVVLVLFILIILSFPKFSRQKIRQAVFGIIGSILFFMIGVVSLNSRISNSKHNYFFKEGAHHYQIRITEPIVVKQNSVKIIIDVLSRNDTVTIGKSLLYLEKNDLAMKLNYGDVLIVNTSFKETKANGNPHEFNYPNYLKLFDIYHQGYLNQKSWLKIAESKNKLFDITYRISSYLSGLIDKSSLDSDNKPILKALLLGQKEDLDKEVLRTYSSAGAMHVLAVSGLHVGIVMMILAFVLKPLKRFSKGRALFVVLVLFGVWFYAFVTGLSPSVLRSSLMFSFIVIGNEIERETNVYQSILVSAFILILIDPFVIFKVGFQLSYLAVLGIVYLQPKIYRLFYIKYKAVDYLWQISSVSIAAQIATFPLGLYYFHQFPNFFLISNLIVIPLAAFVLGLGILYFVVHLVPIINEMILYLLNGLLSFLNATVYWVKELPNSITWGISIMWYEVIFIYLILITFIFAFTLKRKVLVIASSMLTILLLSLFMIRDYKNESINELVIYNIKDELAVDVFYAEKNIFFASDALHVDENKLLFNIKHHWYYKMGEEQAFVKANVKLLFKNALSLNDIKVSVLSLNSKKYLTDFVIVYDVKFISDDVLQSLSKNKSKLILHPKIKKYLKNKILNSYPKYLVFDIEKEGAFIFFF